MKRCSLCVALVWMLAGPAGGMDISAGNTAEIRSAMKSARAGDTILIPPGEYDMGDGLATGASGTRDKPITLRTSGEKGYAKLKITGKSDVGFRILSKFWILQGLDIEGNPKTTLDLMQIDATRGGSDLRMVDCKISRCREFLFKASRSSAAGADNVVLEHCEWFEAAQTAIDVVGGDNWIVRGNYVHDYGTDNAVHYGIFLKGGGKNGLIEGNIVDGKGGTATVGISFGGGLTGRQWLPLVEGGKAAPEHDGGVCRNNIVVNTGDCAYHSNNATNCQFLNNLAYNCGAGFQRQGSYAPDPVLKNNVLSGRIRGAGESKDNLTAVEKTWFVAPERYDFRLTPAGKAALVDKGEIAKECPADFFERLRPSSVLGPVDAVGTESTEWVDRRGQELKAPAR